MGIPSPLYYVAAGRWIKHLLGIGNNSSKIDIYILSQSITTCRTFQFEEIVMRLFNLNIPLDCIVFNVIS